MSQTPNSSRTDSPRKATTPPWSAIDTSEKTGAARRRMRASRPIGPVRRVPKVLISTSPRVTSEGPGGARDQRDPDDSDEGDFLDERHRVAEHGHAETRAGNLRTEQHLPDGVDTVCHRVDL